MVAGSHGRGGGNGLIARSHGFGGGSGLIVAGSQGRGGGNGLIALFKSGPIGAALKESERPKPIKTAKMVRPSVMRIEHPLRNASPH